MEILNIKNSPKLSIQLTDAHRFEIKEYLDLLDVTVDYDVVSMSDMSKKEKRTAISQPGLRYAQAKALIDALMDDGVFQELSLSEKNTVKQRIMSDIQGRMLEDIVLIETKTAKPECKVFKLIFAIGEFDMVVFDAAQESCEIYEIKHSKEAVPQQAQYLLDNEKCKATEHRYGKIMKKCVLYRGKNLTENDIEYKNVEEYLKELS